MVALREGPDGLTVEINGWERLGTLQRTFSIPWDHLDAAYAISDLWPHVKGWRAPGLGIPHVILLGRMFYRDGRDFCSLYRAQPGVLLELRDEHYQRLLVSAPDDVVQGIIRRVTQGTDAAT